MKILRFLPLIGITLAVSAPAQTPIPTIQQPERAIGVPATTDNPFPGTSSSVASNGKDFLVVTSQDRIYGGNAHAVMIVAADGRPALAWVHRSLYSEVRLRDGAAVRSSNEESFLDGQRLSLPLDRPHTGHEPIRNPASLCAAIRHERRSDRRPATADRDVILAFGELHWPGSALQRRLRRRLGIRDSRRIRRPERRGCVAF